jgi:hypothetical protein
MSPATSGGIPSARSFAYVRKNFLSPVVKPSIGSNVPPQSHHGPLLGKLPPCSGVSLAPSFSLRHHYRELPGCAADGKTYKEALVNVEIFIREWIETAKELGRPSPPRAAASPLLKSQRPHSLENQMPKGAPPARGKGAAAATGAGAVASHVRAISARAYEHRRA